MNRIFTLLTFSDIHTSDIDIIDDAYGHICMPADLTEMLDSIEHAPDEKVINELISQIS